MKFSFRRYAVMALILLMTATMLDGCRSTGPKRWWEFWKRSPKMFPVADDTTLPGAPGVAPIEPGQVTEVVPGQLAEASQDRTANPMEVPELQTIYFAYDSYSLSGEMQQRLEQTAAWIQGHPGVTIQIEGHCDERGSTEYNLALGQKRADSVRETLARMGVAPERLVTISYGSERPVDPASNESAWAKNRRAQFLAY